MSLGYYPSEKLSDKKGLFYIVREKSDSLIGRVFSTQLKNRSKKDWVSMVFKDFEELELNVTFVDLKHMSKKEWKNTTKIALLY